MPPETPSHLAAAGTTKGSDKKVPPKESAADLAEKEKLQEQKDSLEAQAEAKYTPKFFSQIKRIAYYIADVGMKVEEASLLVDLDPKEFQAIMEKDELVRKIILIKMLEYKRDLMRTLSARARNGDDKMAQWLLERMFPDEFASGKGRGGGAEDSDNVREAIIFIQKHGDTKPLVSPETQKRVVIEGDYSEVEKKDEKKAPGIIQRVQQYLR